MDYQIADKLIELRKKQGLSQDELADKLSVSRQAISKWERAESLPDTENLIALSKLYEVSLDELVGNHVVEKDIIIVDTKPKVEKNLNQQTVFLITAIIAFAVSIICLALTGYFISELVEIHQPGYVFEPGDTLQSERIGYILSLVFSSIFAIAGAIVGAFAVIKFKRAKDNQAK